MVFLLKYLKSFGKCQGIWLLMPIALFSEAATINVIVGLLIFVSCRLVLLGKVILCLGQLLEGFPKLQQGPLYAHVIHNSAIRNLRI